MSGDFMAALADVFPSLLSLLSTSLSFEISCSNLFFAVGLPGVALGLIALALVREPPRVLAAGAQAVPVARECHAAASAAESLQQVVADTRRWDCGEGGWVLGAEAMLIRFDLADSPDRAPPRTAGPDGGRVGMYCAQPA